MRLTVERAEKDWTRTPESFGARLRRWRRQRGLSQLDLSLDAGISSRHLSFLETGRSQPSLEMIYLLMDTLAVPLRERNGFLLGAGFAPGYSESRFDEREMPYVRKAVTQLLERQLPYPAYAMDAGWNVVDSNASFRELLNLSVPGMEGPMNILRLFFSPQLLRPSVLDWESAARAILLRVRRQLDSGSAPAELPGLIEEVESYPGVRDLLATAGTPPSFDLFVPIATRTGEIELRWLTSIITFAGALDLTLEGLVIECFFPADRATERYFARD